MDSLDFEFYTKLLKRPTNKLQCVVRDDSVWDFEPKYNIPLKELL